MESERGTLKVRNQVYQLVFNLNWIKAHTPFNWLRFSVAVLVLLIFLSFGVGSFAMQQQQQAATEAQILIDNFENAVGPVDRLTSLAGLFNLSGYEQQSILEYIHNLQPLKSIAQ